MAEEKKPAKKMRVSVVQFRSSRDLADNVARHRDYIQRCAKDGARVVVFPECSISGYFDDSVAKATRGDLDKAESRVCAAAKDSEVYVIAGNPTKLEDKTFNSAIVITPEGRIIERFHKVQLAGEKWAVPGDHLSVFPIDDTLCSIIICHDERYPELVRLPVLAGARLVFYVSHESGLEAPEKIEPYRAQIVARAVENGVYVAHANTPWNKDKKEGSHGQSRIITPGGRIIKEAGIYDEEVVTADLELNKADAGLARNSLNCEFLKDWWEQGIARVRRVGC
jgi:predicted amidohydrolase